MSHISKRNASMEDNSKTIIGQLERNCHGGAIFPGVIDSSTGKSVISSRKVTGFTTRGEEEEGVLDTIKSWNRPTVEASAASSGATYVSPAGPWDAFTITERTHRHRCKPCQCPCKGPAIADDATLLHLNNLFTVIRYTNKSDMMIFVYLTI
ncbi:hypothetical protein BBP40_000338 [Aspergillus hancockii]|nr:hypothetical protein BBP40_000338 [Aspergillus hancockii]